MFLSPRGADVRHIGSSESGLSHGPRGVIEIRHLPSFSGVGSGYCAFPSLLIRHRHDIFENSCFLSHETIGDAIHAEDPFKGFVSACPMGSVSIGQFIVGRPDREIGVRDHDRYGRHTQVGSLIWREHVGCLSVHGHRAT